MLKVSSELHKCHPRIWSINIVCALCITWVIYFQATVLHDANFEFILGVYTLQPMLHHDAEHTSASQLQPHVHAINSTKGMLNKGRRDMTDDQKTGNAQIADNTNFKFPVPETAQFEDTESKSAQNGLIVQQAAVSNGRPPHSSESSPATTLTPISEDGRLSLSTWSDGRTSQQPNINSTEERLILDDTIIVPIQAIVTIPENQPLSTQSLVPPSSIIAIDNVDTLPDTIESPLLDSFPDNQVQTGSLRGVPRDASVFGSIPPRTRLRSDSVPTKEDNPKPKLPPLPRAHFASGRTLSTPPVVKRSKSAPKVAGVLSRGSSFLVQSNPQAAGIAQPNKRENTAENGSAEMPGGATSSAVRDTISISPLSFNEYLTLSLSSRPVKQDLVSAELRIEKLINFLSLPPQLESALWFGSFACLDGWLWNFTILPLKCMGALGVLCLHWMKLVGEYGATIAKSRLRPLRINFDSRESQHDPGKKVIQLLNKQRKTSDLQPSHKADLLKGAVILFTCWILMGYDSSRMYHAIRGQSAIKLYVIYSVLEVADKLCAALGQDIFECLFSRESLERRPDGSSKVIRPIGFLLLALLYNVLHSLVLFYQVITLNVAVNSYSNALLTLLLSNQFVEIKTTVFKRFEKENVFQITCADIVERFQLWLMLIIIASRNLVEIGLDGLLGVGGFGLTGIVSAGLGWNLKESSNATGSFSSGGKILPKSFTIFPKWTGQVMGPFLLVLGSEMLVDWLKHAYITKFNNIKPQIYSRFLDVLAKDYYTNAFIDENLTKRLGLPVIPLVCLFIRTSLQTYQMFITTNISTLPLPSRSTALTEPESSAAINDALHRFDTLLRFALTTTPDSIVTFLTISSFFLGAWLILLAIKLVLGILLLGFARRRYKGMKEREKALYDIPGPKNGGFVEVSDEQRALIFMGDKDGEKGAKSRANAAPKQTVPLSEVSRYNMVAKRIW